MLGVTVYILCGITSLTCAVLLYRSYRVNRNPFTFWTAIAFGFFTLNNLFVGLDFVVFPTAFDLSLFRTVPLFLGVLVLVCGLIWESV
ncbi:MAG: DUF5985 family protein [Pseudobdellovibrionaceae bacterium]